MRGNCWPVVATSKGAGSGLRRYSPPICATCPSQLTSTIRFTRVADQLWRLFPRTGALPKRRDKSPPPQRVCLIFQNGVMSHRQLPSARRLKGFISERLSPVIEYLMVWHHFLLIEDAGIEIGSDFGTDSADMHAQGRMKLTGRRRISSWKRTLRFTSFMRSVRPVRG